jgi:hypothetical protein
MTKITYNMIHILPDGKEHIIQENSYPNLDRYQELVGGYIERIICKYKGKRCEMLINEEGKLKQLPFNAKASACTSHDIVGDAVVLFNFNLQ